MISAMSSKNGEVPAMPTTLIPIRVDVVSDDKSSRIVDTLLFDPTCWPIALYTPLQESVERNVQELAHTILSEAEVQGMGRTVRHFTGRVTDLWSPSLQTKIEEQLRPQLWKICNGEIALPKSSTRIAIRLIVHGIVIKEDFLWDPNVPVSPLEFAQDLAKEYKLSDEGAVAVVTTILEQLYGLVVDTSVDVSENPNARMTGAWMMDTKEHIAAVGQSIAHHRPF